METLESAADFFKDDIFASETSGIEIVSAGENYAKCVLPIDRRHRNATGMVMGGAIFTLADFTFAVAANSEDMAAVSLSSNITYLNPAQSGILTAEARCLKSGKRTCSFSVTVTDEKGVSVAIVTATGIHIPRSRGVE